VLGEPLPQRRLGELPGRRFGDRGQDLDEADLRAHLTGRVASWWIPEHIRVLPAIPKTATGKFAKAALRERFAEHPQASGT
jgi:acyl-CoA synthetase (AMP-forming)/AMP-acid ligase II